MVDKAQQSPPIGPAIAAQTKVSVADSEVIGSGVVVTKRDIGLTISPAGLTYEIVFEDEAEQHNIVAEKTGEKSVRLRLIKFDNPLGTSVHFFHIGDVAGTSLWLSLYVEAVGEEVRIVSYTVYLGGNLD